MNTTQRNGSVSEEFPAGLDLSSLTRRERDVLKLLAVGRTRAEIAAELCRSPKTIDSHCCRVYRKLNVNSHAQLIALIHDTDPQSQSRLQSLDTPMQGTQIDERVAMAVHEIERRVMSRPPERYFHNLVVALSAQLNVALSGISEYDHEDRSIVVLVAVDYGKPIDQMVCQADGSACGLTYKEGKCVCERDAQAVFPESEAFRVAEVESYVGVRLETPATGPIGCLWIADRKALADAPYILSVLRALRPRVSSELALQIAIDRVEELGGTVEPRARQPVSPSDSYVDLD